MWFKTPMNIMGSNIFLKRKGNFKVKNIFCFWRSEMEGDNSINRLLSKTFVKQDISETAISEISFSFQLNILLW